MANVHAMVASWVAYSLTPRSRYFAADRPGWHKIPTPPARRGDKELTQRSPRQSLALLLLCDLVNLVALQVPAEGAMFAAARIWASFSAGTASEVKVRIDRRF